LKGSDIKRMRGSPWERRWQEEDLLNILDETGPFDSIFHFAGFNLAWFVEKCFNNQQGKPLELMPFQQVMLDMLWHKKFPMILAARGAGKTFMLALYALLKALLVPGSKIVICGAGFRQAKLVFKYIEQLYEASPLIQEAISRWGGPKYGSDAATLRVGLSSIQAIPIGDGEKIRGIRATVLIADEFASIPEDIFDIVIEPFTAVHLNPAERAAQASFVARLQSLGADDRLVHSIQSTQGFGNQVVISGTPSYKHNHFYKRWAVYMAFLRSKGDKKKLKLALEERQLAATGKYTEINDDDVDNAELSWHHYAVYQLPYTALPDGFMEADIIRKAKATYPVHRFAMEYLAQFPDDTDGFIRRSWIERATPRKPDNYPVEVELYGDPRYHYIMGIDPARFNDNLGVVVLKITERGTELVYCQAWDRTQFSVSAQKIREIVKRFNISYIAMDKGGGGSDIQEWLCKKVDGVKPEDFIWVIPDQMEKFTGDKTGMAAPGRKILELVDFSPAWISQAAHGVEANIQQCHILFPNRGDIEKVCNQYMRHFQKQDITEGEKEALQRDLWGMDDWEAAQISETTGKKAQRTFGVMQEIDECINETCAIMRMVTPKGTETFELPKLAEQPEGLDMRRRDRWSALMLANYAAKVYMGTGHSPKTPAGITPSMRRRGSYTNRGARGRGSVRF
jgi:uncharacterized protein YfeS